MRSSNKSRAMWDLINKELEKDKHNYKNTQLVQNDVIITDPKEVANLINEYYTSVAQNILQYQCNSMFLGPATESEIINIIKNMKNKKSSGIDEIPDFIIKTCYQPIID